jgi:hypothetical protein
MVQSQAIANGAERYHHPGGYTEYPGHPLLAREMVMRAVRDGFDVATSEVLPNRHTRARGIGQSFAFIYRQIMRDRVIPNVVRQRRRERIHALELTRFQVRSGDTPLSRVPGLCVTEARPRGIVVALFYPFTVRWQRAKMPCESALSAV